MGTSTVDYPNMKQWGEKKEKWTTCALHMLYQMYGSLFASISLHTYIPIYVYLPAKFIHCTYMHTHTKQSRP